MRDTTLSADPLLRSTETPLRAVYYPLGFSMEVETNDARVLARAEESFGIFDAATSRHADFPRMHFRAVCDPQATAAPPWPEHSYRASRDLFTVVSSPENFLVCDLERRHATGFYSPALLDAPDHFCSEFLETFAYMTIQRHWATPIHAACVVRDGVGICLAGNSLSGKSTLSYFCAKSGLELLSDNSVWLLNQSEKRVLLGNLARLRLRVQSLELFPELAPLTLSQRADGTEFFAVPAKEMLAGRLVTEARPGPFVFIERVPAGTAPSLEALTTGEARRRLFLDRNPAIEEPHVMRESERVLGEAAGAGAFAMRYTTLEQAWKLLQNILVERKHS